MRDTLKIECFVQALDEYLDAKRERDTTRDRYEGYSWGYHGSTLENRVAEKAATLEDALIAVIRGVTQTQGGGE